MVLVHSSVMKCLKTAVTAVVSMALFVLLRRRSPVQHVVRVEDRQEDVWMGT